MISSYFPGIHAMSNAVKKTISLPADLAKQAEALAQAEGKSLSGVIQDALRQAGIERRLQELRGIQAFWSQKARARGILTEKDLARYLRD
jgi:predicted transcriptional regulator